MQTKDAAIQPIESAPFAQYHRARGEAVAQFQRLNRVQVLWRQLSDATDRLLHDVRAAAATPVTLVAVGGYGRRELFPFSDVDVLLLTDDRAVADPADGIPPLLQRLWDRHIPVSHATRTVAATVDAARHDPTVAASLLDARFISGDRALFQRLKKRFKQEIFGSETQAFVAAKLRERDQRHAKWGDSRFMLEPNIKEGKGGLRDLHTLAWLARYCYPIARVRDLAHTDLLTPAEWRAYQQAYLFFSTLRAHLHILGGRAEERLIFDRQLQLAEKLKFRGRNAQQKAERLMLRYFQFTRQTGALTRILCAVLEEEKKYAPSVVAPSTRGLSLPPDLKVNGGRLQFSPLADITLTPGLIVEIFYVAQRESLDIHPRAYRQITRALPKIGRQLPFEGAANRLFLKLLLMPEGLDASLRRMNETGILAALIPEFGRIAGMMQYDGYHTYTVDEHTLVAIGNLAVLESGAWSSQMPIATAAVKEVADRAPLYLAMLCHDIAKGSGGSHAEKGERLVLAIARRFGLSDAQGELAAWLVKHHLLMSETAFKRDLDDTKTIEDFVALVHSPERLRLLLLVTVADIKAVGPAIWNGWKGSLIRMLYHRAMLQMGMSADDSSPHSHAVEKLMATLPAPLLATAHMLINQQLPHSWWFRPQAEKIATIQAYDAWKKNPHDPAIVITHDAFRAISELTFCLAYQPGLFRTLAGVMAWIGASIVSARIMLLADQAAIAVISIQNTIGESFAEEEKRFSTLPALIEKGLRGALAFEQELPRRRTVSQGREVAIEPALFIDQQLSAEATVVEINARDRLGLLYDILGAFEAERLHVVTAHIATYGQKAVDVFYVKDDNGMKILHPVRLTGMQWRLLTALEAKEMDTR